MKNHLKQYLMLICKETSHKNSIFNLEHSICHMYADHYTWRREFSAKYSIIGMPWYETVELSLDFYVNAIQGNIFRKFQNKKLDILRFAKENLAQNFF